MKAPAEPPLAGSEPPVRTTRWVITESDAAMLHVSGLPSHWLVSSRGQRQWVAPARASFEDILRALDAVR